MPNLLDPNQPLRERMVADQLVVRGIRDARLLEVMRRVPRHLFVPPERAALAYADRALAIAHGQTISQPYMVAVMTEALALKGTERVLEVGTGSGYQAAILAELAREVITIEREPQLASAAEARLARCGYTNIRVIVGDGTEGFEEAAPFDAVVVTAGAPHAVRRLEEQLADGGTLVIPIGRRDHQVLRVQTRRGDELIASTLDDCVFVPLVGRDGWAD
jgi:protein-L-isoaspartate(D-aspartate) O-methyltransferase